MRLTRARVLWAVTAVVAVVVVWISSGSTRWALLGGLCTASGLVFGLGVAFPKWQMFGPSRCRVSTEEQVVAITFDDGPDPVCTPRLLDLLARRQVQATFFCVGRRVVEHPETALRIVTAGHLIGNHSFEHSWRTNLYGEPRLRADLERAQTEIARVTGKSPTFFRPPMGLTNQRVFRVTRALALTVVGYSIRGRDRGHGSVSSVVRHALRRVRPGAVILLHDGGARPDRLLAVVEKLVDQLQAQGYRCLRLDVLMATESNR